MTRCTSLLISNSTFSFTAAAMNRPIVPPQAGCGCPRFFRPSPLVVAATGEASSSGAVECEFSMSSFDPWNAFPLLNVSRGRKPKKKRPQATSAAP